jgi:polar amino acid transport system permease protein
MWSWSAFFQFLTSPLLLQGAWTTIWLTVISMTFGLVLGLLLALMRMSSTPMLRAPAGFYIWVFRGTPLLVQLVIIYTGLPTVGIKFGVLTSAVLGLSLNEAAYLSEVVRSGILSVPKGQFEAARALGMPPSRVMRVVVLPQALRIMVPPLGNSLNGMLKTTTLASVISVVELLRRTQLAVQVNFRVLEGLVACAVYFLVLTTIWQLIQTRIEVRLNRGHSGAAPRSRGGRRGRGTRQALDPAIGGEYR